MRVPPRSLSTLFCSVITGTPYHMRLWFMIPSRASPYGRVLLDLGCFRFSVSILHVLNTHLSAISIRIMQISEISMANSRQNIRKLVKDGFVIRKPQKVEKGPCHRTSSFPLCATPT